MAAVARRSALESILKERVGQNVYQLWFAGHTVFRARKGILEVGVPNLHFQEWLAKKYTKDIAAAAKEVLGRIVTVKFRIDPVLFRSHRAAQEEAKLNYSTKAKKPAPVIEFPSAPTDRKHEKKQRKGKSPTPSMFPEPDSPVRIGKHGVRLGNRRWSDLKDFVPGTSNRLALAAAQSVVERPGEDGNPLVLHGPVGTGKSHLLEGIYAGIRRKSPSLAVQFATAEEFTHRFVQSMRSGKLSSFRRQFRDCDVLLIDNLHFLAKKKATQEEFLHTFDRLANRGAQVVVTADCHPRLAENLLPELVDRLLGGTVAALQPPDAQSRLEILRSKSAGASPTIPDAVLQDLAAKLRGNVRELEGAIRNLRHYAKVEGKPINLTLANEALGDLLRHAVKIVGISDVDTAVCQALRLKPGTLQSHARSWSVSHPRMIAIYLSRKHTAASFSEIGKHFGGRNHSTAVAAENKVREWIDEDSHLAGGPKPYRVVEIIENAEKLMGV